jgi:6-phosphogluconolactonase
VRLEVLPDEGAVAVAAARWIAEAARAAVAARGVAAVALSRPRPETLRALAAEEVPWGSVHLFQVDERVAPAGQPDRNLTLVQEGLARPVRLPAENLHPMPVEAGDLGAAADRYARVLEAAAGTPPVLDAIHLGIGRDGHTASLVPGDPVLEVTAADVAITGRYEGHLRMTLTYPALDRGRALLWVVMGAEKAPALARLLAGDRSIPAGRVRRDRALVLADEAAAARAALGG